MSKFKKGLQRGTADKTDEFFRDNFYRSLAKLLPAVIKSGTFRKKKDCMTHLTVKGDYLLFCHFAFFFQKATSRRGSLTSKDSEI